MKKNININTLSARPFVQWFGLPLVIFAALIFTITSARMQSQSSENNMKLFDLTGMLKTQSTASIVGTREQEIKISFNELNFDTALKLKFPLLDGKFYEAIRRGSEGFERFADDEFTWRGKISGDNNFSGDVILTVKDKALSGLIYSPNAVYEIVPQENFKHLLVEIDQSHFPECGGAIVPEELESETNNNINKQKSLFTFDRPAINLLSDRQDSIAADDGSQIDVMVVYTAAVRNFLGGATQAQTFAQQAVASTNTAYLNSGVVTRLRLVQAMEVSYADNGTGSNALNWVTADATVAAARNAAKADLVSIITQNVTDVCGVAYRMPTLSSSFESYGFSQVSRSCAIGGLTFAHELGHNQSLNHNPENSNGGSLFPYGYDHQQNGIFATIMAYPKPYNPVCTAPNGCPKIPFFSNPNVTFSGLPIGIANERESFRALNNTALTVSQFRDSGSGATPTPTPPPSSGIAFAGTGVGAIPDGQAGTPPQFGQPLVVSFNVSGVSGPITFISLNITMTHTWVGDLEIILRSPGGAAAFPIVNRIGVTAAGQFGDSSNYGGTYTFSDAAPGNIWTTATTAACGDACAVASGSYRTTGAGGETPTNFTAAFAGLTPAQRNGVWTLTFRDAGASDTGAVLAASMRILPHTAPINQAKFDFDGDRKSDISVFRPGSGVWYLQQSSIGFTGVGFGQNGDLIVPTDYDGDHKTDVAVFRPSNGAWYLQQSTAGFSGIAFGASGDIPMPADYDGDGKADIAVFRPSNGVWYIQQSTAGFIGVAFGANGDYPVAADYDGDGKADIAVFRPSNGVWYLQRSQLGFTGISFGTSGDKPVAADYDGDSKADIAVFRPSNGVWYLQQSQAGFTGVAFGTNGDAPVAADYDGDGKSDIAVFRPSNGVWYLQRTTQGFTGIAFGANGDKPAPNAFVP